MSSQKIYGLCGLKHHIVDIRDHVTRRDGQTTNKQGKIGLLSQWKLEAEFRNYTSVRREEMPKSYLKLMA